MSTKEKDQPKIEKTVATNEQLANLLPIHINEDGVLDSIFNRMDATETKDMMEATSNYLDMAAWEGKDALEGKDFVFTGLTNFNTVDKQSGETKTMPAVQLVDREGKQWIFAGAVVVSALKRVEKMPCPVRIVRGAMKKASGGGSYYDSRVFVI